MEMCDTFDPCTSCHGNAAFRLKIRDTFTILCQSCISRSFVHYDGITTWLRKPNGILVMIANEPIFRQITRELMDVKSRFLD